MTVTLCLSCSPDVGVYSIRAFRGPPRSGVAFPTTSGLYCLEVCWQLHRGFSEVPLSRVWPSLPHLVSNLLGICWQLHRGFPRSPSVGCGLPYHISSLTLWESAGNCIGGFQEPPRSGVAFLTTSGLYCLEFYWQLLWDPNSTELNNNSTPTRSPTGSLKSNA